VAAFQEEGEAGGGGKCSALAGLADDSKEEVTEQERWRKKTLGERPQRSRPRRTNPLFEDGANNLMRTE